jgi:hypothetical protein
MQTMSDGKIRDLSCVWLEQHKNTEAGNW